MDFGILEGWTSRRTLVAFISTTPATCRSSQFRVMIEKTVVEAKRHVQTLYVLSLPGSGEGFCHFALQIRIIHPKLCMSNT